MSEDENTSTPTTEEETTTTESTEETTTQETNEEETTTESNDQDNADNDDDDDDDDDDDGSDDETAYDSVLVERGLKREPFDFSTLPSDTEHINLSAKSWGDDNAAIQQIVELFPNLKKLTATNTSMPDQDLELLASGCPNLEELYLHRSYLTSAGLAALGNGCPKLRVLKASSCFGIDAQGLLALAAGCGQTLEQLDLAQCTVYLDDEALAAIGSGFPNLVKLDLRGNPKISDDGMVSLTLPKLQEIDLAFCSGITNKGVEALVANTFVLTSVNLSNTKVTDGGVVSLVSSASAKTLADLNLSILPLTDLSLEAISANCTNLQKIVATKIVKFKTEAVLQFVETCQNVTQLNFDKCRMLTPAVIGEIKKMLAARRE